MTLIFFGMELASSGSRICLEKMNMRMIAFFLIFVCTSCSDPLPRSGEVPCAIGASQFCKGSLPSGREISMMITFSGGDINVSYRNQEDECRQSAQDFIPTVPDRVLCLKTEVKLSDALKENGDVLCEISDVILLFKKELAIVEWKAEGQTGELTCTMRKSGQPHDR